MQYYIQGRKVIAIAPPVGGFAEVNLQGARWDYRLKYWVKILRSAPILLDFRLDATVDHIIYRDSQEGLV